MSEWQSPQDYPRRETDGIKRLVDAVASTYRQVRESTSNLLRTAGLYVTEAGMRVARSLLVEGDFASTGSADIDGALNVDAEMTVGGNATFSGAMRIEGTLSLPAGIIDNDALANPVVPVGTSNTVSGFGLTTTETVVVSATVSVPAGFTRCMATGLGSIFFLNPTASVDYLYARVYIETPSQSWWGIRPLSMVGPGNGSAALAPNWMVMLTGLTPGEPITFSVRARTGFAPISDSANLAGIAGQALFFR